jgi:hypothetical protein
MLLFTSFATPSLLRLSPPSQFAWLLLPSSLLSQFQYLQSPQQIASSFQRTSLLASNECPRPLFFLACRCPTFKLEWATIPSFQSSVTVRPSFLLMASTSLSGCPACSWVSRPSLQPSSPFHPARLWVSVVLSNLCLIGEYIEGLSSCLQILGSLCIS